MFFCFQASRCGVGARSSLSSRKSKLCSKFEPDPRLPHHSLLPSLSSCCEMYFRAVATAGLVFLCLTGQVSASCAYGTILEPRPEGGAVKVNTFGYSGEKGPASWVNLDPTKNALCAHGSKQSPIDMSPGSFAVIRGRNLSLSIPDRAAGGTDFENLGTTVEVVVAAGGGGNMTFEHVPYTLQQFHFHLPSEHLDNGTSMAMEMHMVWQGPAAGQIAVIANFIDINDDDNDNDDDDVDEDTTAGNASTTKNTALLDEVLGSVDKIARPGTKTETGALKMSELVEVLSAGSFQTYEGSLTTPPCTEGVRWLVSTQKLAIKPGTFKMARSVIGFNARFLQNNVGVRKRTQKRLRVGTVPRIPIPYPWA
ncbi:hypothetical protein JDV02_010778 [Purpureocillium takamizusanense]|uniref:carbonic anhydrase n=1 Tax=Purpureocillium takamizusanense TaxID=2060973 RepID=A0A9Q8QSZ2_9HYPO|nr:uncharacterized protein JDV02_010778 [Purpureocillium takamizusanense]UNI25073.1 hypothetical protein JDV02_010778 [Purpureocillium takamizusanense]